MATSLDVSEVKDQIEMSAEDRRLKRLWDALPADRAVTEAEAFEALLRAADRWSGDDAWASAMLATLRGMGAVHGRPGGTVKRSAEFPVLPDLVPGNAAYEELRERENREQREQEIANDNRTARQNFEASPEGRQRKELLELVDERIELALDEFRRELEPPAVKGLREKLSAATGGGQEE
jgi:hypothetical protein